MELDNEYVGLADRFELLVQSVTDYAIFMLDTTGIVTSWNAGAERFKGYRAEEIIGSHFSRFYLEEDRDAGIPQRALATALSEGRFEAEGWRCRKDGSQFWANVIIDPVKSKSGKLVGFAKITRDLTERREAQLALEQAQQALFQSQKIEALGKLTGGVAHDFNNLLAAIIGSLDIAKRRAAEGKDITRFLDNAMEAAERGTLLTQRMLAFARKQEMQIKAVDLSTLVRGMAPLLEQTVGTKITIDTHFPLVLKLIQADPIQLELALMNIVVNARDAMPDGGRILIAARKAQVQNQNNLTSGEYICLSLTDDGVGMDEQTLAKAIDPFFTTKGIGKGTGLGLSMVAGMAEQFGGTLRIKSVFGEGTTVTLWLPIAIETPVPEAVPAPSNVVPCKLSPMTILAVDDDDIVLMNTAEMLRDLGHTVLQASSGSQALQILGRHPVDLLIVDYAMPNMRGDELADAVQAGWPDMPILIMSGYAELPEGFTARFRRLPKPFLQKELGKAMVDVIPEERSGQVLPFRSRF